MIQRQVTLVLDFDGLVEPDAAVAPNQLDDRITWLVLSLGKSSSPATSASVLSRPSTMPQGGGFWEREALFVVLNQQFHLRLPTSISVPVQNSKVKRMVFGGQPGHNDNERRSGEHRRPLSSLAIVLAFRTLLQVER